jgi:hypothetical protein
MKRIIIFSIISFLILSFNAPLFAKDIISRDASVPEIVGDALWVRPLGFMKTALGATAFVISLPVTIPLQKNEEAKEFLITYPYNYYFKRSIGKY